MLNIDSDLKTIYKNDYFPACETIATKRNVFYFPELELTIGSENNGQIVQGTFNITESICSEANLNFGACESNMLTVQLADVDESIVGKEMIVSQVVNETYTIQLGNFFVESCHIVDDTIFKEITAYDGMKKFDVDVIAWYNAISWNVTNTIKKLRISLYTYLGIEYEDVTLCNDSMPVIKTINANSLNGKDVLRAIMQINGCFGHFGRDGKLYHVILPIDSAVPSETVTKNEEIRTIKCEDYTASAIDKVKITQEDADADGDAGATYGTGNNCYTISGNLLTFGWNATQMATAAENVSSNMFNRSYKPIISSEIIGLPYLEVGDKVSAVIGDNTYSSYILRRTLCISTMKDSYTASGDQVLKKIENTKDTLKKLQGKTNVLKRTVEEMSNTVTDLSTNIEENYSTTTQMETAITQNNRSITAKIENEVTSFIIGSNVCDHNPITEDDICNEDDESVVNSVLVDTQAKLELLSNQFSVSLSDKVAQLNANLILSTTQLTASITNLTNETQAQFEMTENAIELCAKTGELSASLSLENGTITLSGNRLIVNSNNFSLTSEGNINARNATLSGSISSAGLSCVGEYGTVKIKDGRLSFNNTNGDESLLEANILMMKGGAYGDTIVSPTQISVGPNGINGAGTANIGNVKINGISSGYIQVGSHYVSLDNHYHSDYASLTHYHSDYSEVGHTHASSSLVAMWVPSNPGLYFLGSQLIPDISYCESHYGSSSSDFRLKRNIQSVDDIGDFFMELKTKSYSFKGDLDDGYTHYGLLAQEVQKSADKYGIDANGLVREYKTRSFFDEGMYTGDSAYRIDYESFHALEIYMIQKQQKEINDLQEIIDQMREEKKYVKSK